MWVNVFEKGHMTEFDPQLSSVDENDRLALIEKELSRNSLHLVSQISLEETAPDRFPAPKFQIGAEVLWVNVATHGFGKIIGLVFADGVSVCAKGYHYLILFSSESLSRQDCIADWAFEDDIELQETHSHLLPKVLHVDNGR